MLSFMSINPTETIETESERRGLRTPSSSTITCRLPTNKYCTSYIVMLSFVTSVRVCCASVARLRLLSQPCENSAQSLQPLPGVVLHATSTFHRVKIPHNCCVLRA